MSSPRSTSSTIRGVERAASRLSDRPSGWRAAPDRFRSSRPPRLFAKDAYGRPVRFATARDLARRYRTSFLTTAVQLVRIGDLVSRMIIWSRPGRRWKWFLRSPQMPTGVWPHDQPGPRTLAYRLLRGEEPSPGPRMVEWREWIRVRDPELFFLVEDSMRLDNGDVLTLLEWPDEEPLYNIYCTVPFHLQGLVGERG